MQAVFDGWLQCLIFLVGDGGSQKKGLSRNERDQIFPITQQQFLDLSVQEQALTAVGWHGERLTCGLSGKLWGFQRTPLG